MFGAAVPQVASGERIAIFLEMHLCPKHIIKYFNIKLFFVKYAEQSLMKSAIKTSEESWIEQQMLEDKKRATDWEATNEAIEEQVARESYLQWLQDQEKQARQVGKTNTLTHTWMHLCAHSRGACAYAR